MHMKLTEWLVWVPWHPHGSILPDSLAAIAETLSRALTLLDVAISLIRFKGCNTLKCRAKFKPLHAHWGIKEIKCLCFYWVCLCICKVSLCTTMSLNTSESRKIRFSPLILHMKMIWGRGNSSGSSHFLLMQDECMASDGYIGHKSSIIVFIMKPVCHAK